MKIFFEHLKINFLLIIIDQLEYIDTIYVMLPFRFEELDDFIDFDHLKSNNLKILDHPLT